MSRRTSNSAYKPKSTSSRRRGERGTRATRAPETPRGGRGEGGRGEAADVARRCRCKDPQKRWRSAIGFAGGDARSALWRSGGARARARGAAARRDDEKGTGPGRMREHRARAVGAVGRRGSAIAARSRSERLADVDDRRRRREKVAMGMSRTPAPPTICPYPRSARRASVMAFGAGPSAAEHRARSDPHASATCMKVSVSITHGEGL